MTAQNIKNAEPPPGASWAPRPVESTHERAALGQRRRWTTFTIAAGLLLLAFAKPLVDLFRYAVDSSVYSHVLLMPFISGYLVWLKRGEIAASLGRTSKFGLAPAILAVSLVAGYWVARSEGWQPSVNDYLSVVTLAFVCAVVALFLFCCGAAMTRLLAFPLAMLVFLVPAPDVVLSGIKVFLQHASAEAAYSLISVSSTPVLRDGLVFRMASIAIEVAEECSGVRSSLVLFITGLLAGHLLLRTPWKRAVLAFVVIPIGVARNAFRIFTLVMLCEYVDPAMIDSAIHKRGGPVFFAISLVPFFLLLWFFKRSERANPQVSPAHSLSGNERAS